MRVEPTYSGEATPTTITLEDFELPVNSFSSHGTNVQVVERHCCRDRDTKGVEKEVNKGRVQTGTP